MCCVVLCCVVLLLGWAGLGCWRCNASQCFSVVQGAALGTMVGWMTYGNRKFEALDSKMRELIPPLRHVMLDLIPMVDADTSAFTDFMVK